MINQIRRIGALVAAVAMVGVVTLAGLGSALADPATAQGAQWLEQDAGRFIIVYREGDEPQRDYFSQHIDALYADLAAAFGAEIDGPIILRLYPTLSDYLVANPLATDVQGIVAQTHRAQREIGIVVDRALEGGDASLDSAARYELAHLFAYRLSDGRLPAGMQEGMAAYMAGPDGRQTAGVAQLRDAWSRDALYSWSELAAPGAAYLDPPTSYPEGLAVVHYLVAEGDLPAVMAFVRAAASASGWRSALEMAFGKSPEQLEAGWRGWLPSYLDGGWQFHAVYTRDLAPAESLLERGDYEAAAAHLRSALSFLSREDPELAERAHELLRRAESAGAARAHLWEARSQLLAGDYAAAASSAEAAGPLLAQTGDRTGVQLADEIADRAHLGLDARGYLETASALPPWRVTQARFLADRAATEFARLGNDVAASEARVLRAGMDRRQAPAGWALFGLGWTLLAWNVARRARDRAAENG